MRKKKKKKLKKSEVTKMETWKLLNFPLPKGCTKCTATHSLVPSERKPEASLVTPTHQAFE